MQKERPEFFNLMQIRLPVGAVTSITHRITGIILALGIPVGIYLLQQSLLDPQRYARVAALLGRLPARLLALLFIWALAQHWLAGLRHLLSDIDIGSHLQPARTSAWSVNIGALVIALLGAGALF